VWTIKDGAPDDVHALAQTFDGFLWLGTSSGLYRFDGIRFEHYQPQPGVALPSHSIYSLMATPDGGLWIAFEPTGLGFLKAGFLTVFSRPQELPDSPIHSLAQDYDGRIWAGTETGLVLREGTRWISIGHDWNFTPDMIRALFVDRDGTLWVATLNSIALLRRGSKAFELAGAVGTGVTSLAEAKDGRVWFADNGGISAQLVRPVPVAGRNPDSEGPKVVADGLHELLFDREGDLWITRLDSGIVRIRNPEKLGNRVLGPHDHEFESLNGTGGFPGAVAYKLLEDREGNIWVGCSKGLVQIRRNRVVPVSLPQRYQNIVLHAGEDGEIWVGTTNTRPLLHIRGESVLFEKVGERASSVFRDSNGDVWWGSDTGIWRQRDMNFKYFPIPRDAGPPAWVYEIISDGHSDGLWVRLGDFGTVHFKQGVWNLNERPNGVPFVGPSASFQDPSGRVWLGFAGGQLYVFDRDRVTIYSQSDGLDVGRIKVIRGLGQHIWVGGELGLMLFSEGHFRRVNVDAGEPFGAVSGIIETVDRGLWLNEMRGIVQIPPEEVRQLIDDSNHRVKYRRFDYLDGLPGMPEIGHANSTAVEAWDGRLWFATDDQLAWIDPAHITWNTLPPPVSILSIGNERGPQPISDEVKFVAGTHAVEIDYTALSLSIPERVEFRYKLKGVDKDWQDAGTRRQAFYTNLGPGRYQFQVIACNNDGVWNETGAGLSFVIASFIYQTLWFRLLYVVAGVGVLWVFSFIRMRQVILLSKTRLEERVQERERIARELHDTLLQGFQGLILRFQAITNRIAKEDPTHNMMEQALDHADEVLLEGRERVRNLRSEGAAVKSLSEALASFVNELSQDHGADISVSVVGTPQVLHAIVRDEVFRIGREALANALKHSSALRIEAEIIYDCAGMRLRIRDNGDGIDEATLNGGRPGHWGLSGMRERAKKIGARLNLWSRLGAGTEVELIVPASIAYSASLARSRWFWITRVIGGGR
jgi:signal transduction histidine kinase/ligand-binding sensor domain-containing protein